MLIDTTELRERLEGAVRNLTALRDDPNIEDHEYLRFAGKVSGAKLALSHLDDAERMMPSDPESLAEAALALLGVEATPENMAKVLSIRLAALSPDVAAALTPKD